MLFNCAFGRLETHTTKLDMHEKRFEEMDVLAGRIGLVEEATEDISGVLPRPLCRLACSVPRSRQYSPRSSIRHAFAPSLVGEICHAFNTSKLNHGPMLAFKL